MRDTALRPEVVEKRIAAAKRTAKLKAPTNIERAVKAKLEASGIVFEEQFPIGQYMADFFLPESKEVIEADGDYWHSRPETKVRDARKDIYCASLGYIVWRFTERDIKSGQAFKHPIFANRNATAELRNED